VLSCIALDLSLLDLPHTQQPGLFDTFSPSGKRQRIGGCEQRQLLGPCPSSLESPCLRLPDLYGGSSGVRPYTWESGQSRDTSRGGAENEETWAGSAETLSWSLRKRRSRSISRIWLRNRSTCPNPPDSVHVLMRRENGFQLSQRRGTPSAPSLKAPHAQGPKPNGPTGMRIALPPTHRHAFET
jgi:hypothetical protein